MEVKEESLDLDLKDVVAIKQEPISIQITEGFEISGYSYLPYIKQEICDASEALLNSDKYSLDVKDRNSGVDKLVRHDNFDLNESKSELNVYCELPNLKNGNFEDNLLNVKHEDSDVHSIFKTELIAEECDLPDLKTEDLNVSDHYFNSTKSQKPLRKLKTRNFRNVPKKNNYLCPICLKGCFSSESRTKHVTSHFAKDFVTCRFCGQFFTDEIQFLLHHFNHFVKCRRQSETYGNSMVHYGKKPASIKIIKGSKTCTKNPRHLNGHTNPCETKKFSCKICSKCFELKSDLIGHSKIHNVEKPFKCENCLKRFSCKSALGKHLRIHTGEKPYKCEICLNWFTCKSTLRTHLRIHTGEKPYKCEICLKRFTSKSTLTRHLRVHSSNKPFKCELCFKVFWENSSVQEHFKLWHPKVNIVILCKKYCNKATLKTHHLRMHAQELKVLRCEFCSKSFALKYDLDRHSIIHTEKPVKCEICLTRLSCKSALRRHLRIHTGEKPFKCEICLKRFHCNSNLRSHARIHTDDRPFKCDLCSKRFSLETSLTIHSRIHNGEKPFKCDVCDKQFNCSANLRQHLKRFHLIPFKCELCSKVFSDNSSLKEHYKILHPLVNPFMCEVCSKQFGNKSTLKRHHLRVHAQELKVFRCGFCCKSFALKYDLDRHSRIHTGEKPYKCEICSRGFANKSGLKEHSIIHTGDKPYKCDICARLFSRKSKLKRHLKTHTLT